MPAASVIANDSSEPTMPCNKPPLDNTSVGYNQGLVGRPGGRFGYLSLRKAF